MIVKKSIVEQWYVKTHPVYKNFAYLFQNPLWNRAVPTGFSVCPYFWLSLFSLTVFRPFVHFSRLIVPRLKGMGKGVYFFCKVVVILSAVSVVVIALMTIGNFYLRSVAPVPACLVLWWSVLSLLGIITGDKVQRKCQVHYYVYVWAVASLLAALVFSTDEFVQEWVWIGKTLKIGLWGAGYGIVIALKWLGMAILSCLRYLGKLATWTPIRSGWSSWIPWWLWMFCSFGLFVLAMVGIAKLLEVFVANEKLAGGAVVPEKTDWFEDWRSMLVRKAQISPQFQCQVITRLPGHLPIDYRGEARPVKGRPTPWWFVRDRFYEEAATVFFSYYALGLRKHKLLYPLGWLRWNVSFENQMRMLYDEFYKLPIECPNEIIELIEPDYSRLDVIVGQLVQEEWFKKEWDKGVKIIAKMQKEKSDRAKRWEASKLHKACLGTTAWLSLQGNKVEKSFTVVGTGIWKALTFTGRNSRIFASYLWMLVKAKKQGACPYFKFVDENKPVKSSE